jgi:hypothetical protein
MERRPATVGSAINGCCEDYRLSRAWCHPGLVPPIIQHRPMQLHPVDMLRFEIADDTAPRSSVLAKFESAIWNTGRLTCRGALTGRLDGRVA